MLERIQDLDRRWIFLMVALAATVPFALGVTAGNVEAGEPVKAVFRKIDSLPPGSVVWMGFDSYATTQAEVAPASRAVARHLFSKGHRIVATSLVPDGALISRHILGDLGREMGKTYGVDYVVLGYKSGSQIVIRQACESLPAIFPFDSHGTPIQSIPLTTGLQSARNFAMIFTAADNHSIIYYAVVANSHYGIPVAGSATAVMVPELYPYYNSGQLLGVIGGMRGAAEYEGLLGQPGPAQAGMAVQSVVHFLIAGGIVLGNVAFLSRRRRRLA